MTTRHTTHSLARPARGRLLGRGFWLLALMLGLNLLIIIIPAYMGGLTAAYHAGWRLKDQDFAVPLYTPYSLLTNLLVLPALLAMVFTRWVAPLLGVVWALRLAQLWATLPARTKYGWLAVLLPLVLVTLATRDAAYAFYIWFMD